MLWTNALKRTNSTGNHVDNSKEKPNGKEDFDSDFGLFKVFEGLPVLVENVDGVEEVLLELVFGGGLSG